MFRLLFARRSDWAAFTVACVLSLTLMSLGRGQQERAVWFIQHTILSPVNAVVGWVDAGVGVYWENQKLKKRLAQIQMEADAMRTDRVENARLRRLLDLSQENPSDLTAARVTARSLDRLGGSLTIDKGSKDGVLPERAVITPEGLVGRVERCTAHEARVLTLLHHDCAVAVRVGRSRVDGVLQWEFGDRPTLNPPLRLRARGREERRLGDDLGAGRHLPRRGARRDRGESRHRGERADQGDLREAGGGFPEPRGGDGLHARGLGPRPEDAGARGRSTGQRPGARAAATKRREPCVEAVA